MTADVPLERAYSTPSGERLREGDSESKRPIAVSVAALSSEGRALERHPRERLWQLAVSLGTHIRRRPLASLAVAVGVGFVIGGALSSRAGRITLAAATRHFVHQLLKRVL
jgi:hypothetical protein